MLKYNFDFVKFLKKWLSKFLWFKQIKQGGLKCCWKCKKCEDYSYILDDMTCQECDKGFWPNLNLTGNKTKEWKFSVYKFTFLHNKKFWFILCLILKWKIISSYFFYVSYFIFFFLLNGKIIDFNLLLNKERQLL